MVERPDGRPVYDSYARLSKNASGKLEKVEDQHADNEDVIAEAGGVVGLRLSDNALSAWNPKVVRKAWEQLLARIASGESDGCAVWNTDRLLRLPRDLERLIDLGDAGYVVLSAHGERDLSDYNDRYILRQEAAAAAKASDQASERIKFRFRNIRRRGRLHTHGRTFGFPGRDHTFTVERDDETGERFVRDPESGERIERPMVDPVLVERERAALRDATREILADAPVGEIVRGWNAEGLRTATGKTWTVNSVRDVLLRARNAGLVEHDGEIVGEMPGDPIVPVAQFERLRAKFQGRRRGRQPGFTYVGSGVLRCGACGKNVTGRPASGTYPDGETRRQYSCLGERGCGKVHADMRGVDHVLREFVLARQTDPEHAAGIERARRAVGDRLGEVDRELAECEALAATLAERLGRREMSLAAHDRAVEPLTRDIDRLTAERAALDASIPSPRQAGNGGAGSRSVVSYEEALADWEGSTVPERRTMLREAVDRGRVYLDPAKGRKRFSPDRLRVVEAPPPVPREA